MSEIKEGRPWTVVAKMDTFEAANARRAQLQEDQGLQVKIRWMRKPPGKFAVKTRLTEQAYKKAHKNSKKRNKNLQKKKTRDKIIV